MAAPVYLTKGELRAKLLIRLGYGGLGAAAGAFVPTADDLLEEAQQVIFEVLADETRVREWTMTSGIGQRWYDIPTDCDHEEILSVHALEDDGKTWSPVHKGVEASHDTVYSDISERPQRWDIRYNPATSKAQIEVWPYQDAAYVWKIEGGMTPNNFVADGHRAVVDSRLLLMYAIAHGKAHLKRADAGAAMEAWDKRYKVLKAKQHRGQDYVRQNPNNPPRPARAEPKVV